jgi:hypothetical protein
MNLPLLRLEILPDPVPTIRLSAPIAVRTAEHGPS